MVMSLEKSIFVASTLLIWHGFKSGQQSLASVQDPHSHLPPHCLLVLFLSDPTSTPLLLLFGNIFLLFWLQALVLLVIMANLFYFSLFVLVFNIVSLEFAHCQCFKNYSSCDDPNEIRSIMQNIVEFT